jgi:bacteriocin biosynthesis cyclodehydratase domain-containing protein
MLTNPATHEWFVWRRQVSVVAEGMIRAVRIAPDRVLVERGSSRRAVTGALAAAAEWLVGQLRLGTEPSAILAQLPATLRDFAAELLSQLEEVPASGDSVRMPASAHRSARPVALHGRNAVAAVAAARLQTLGLPVAVMPNLQLDSPSDAESSLPSPTSLEDVPPALIVAAAESGLPDELFRLAALARDMGVPYASAWIEGTTGYIGPLSTPTTACLRCYALRRASNDPRPAITEALRLHAAAGSPLPRRLPMPLLATVGEALAIAVHAHLSNRTLADPANRVIEIDLISFRVQGRPVRRVPGCPGCTRKAR